MALYWMHEQSGKMKEIVVKFSNNKTLTQKELDKLRWYVKQWVEDTRFRFPGGIREKLLEELKAIKVQDKLMEFVTGKLPEYGIDPF